MNTEFFPDKGRQLECSFLPLDENTSNIRVPTVFILIKTINGLNLFWLHWTWWRHQFNQVPMDIAGRSYWTLGFVHIFKHLCSNRAVISRSFRNLKIWRQISCSHFAISSSLHLEETLFLCSYLLLITLDQAAYKKIQCIKSTCKL